MQTFGNYGGPAMWARTPAGVMRQEISGQSSIVTTPQELGMSLALGAAISEVNMFQTNMGTQSWGSLLNTSNQTKSDPMLYASANFSTSSFQPKTTESNSRGLSFYESQMHVLANQLKSFDQGRSLITTGLEQAVAGQAHKAVEFYLRALPISRMANDKVGQAVTHSLIAQASLSMGKEEQALSHFKQAYELSLNVKDLKQQMFALRGLGAAYLPMGETALAIEAFSKARVVANTLNDQNAQAEIISSQGWGYQLAGDPQRALAYYYQALDLLIKIGNRAAEVKTRVGIGLLQHSLGKPQSALEQYRKAFNIAKDCKTEVSDSEFAGILVSAGEAHQSLGFHNQALYSYYQALPFMKDAGNRAGIAGTLLSIARIKASQGARQEAYDYYLHLLWLIGESERNPALEAGVEAGLGDFYLWEDSWALYYGENVSKKKKSENFQSALTHYDNALNAMREIKNSTGEAGILTSIGMLHERCGKPQQALDHYRKAIEILENQRALARLEEFRAGLTEQSSAVYTRTILLHLQLGQQVEAFELTERARARSFLDQLGNPRLDLRKGADSQLIAQEQALAARIAVIERQYRQEWAKPAPQFNQEKIQSLQVRLAASQREYEELLIRLKASNPAYASLVSVETIRLPRIQQLMDGNSTLVSYFVTPEKTLVFIITRTSFQVRELSVRQVELEAAIKNFRAFPNLEKTPTKESQKLYKWLITPVKSEMKTSLIGIIPHGVLHQLPFAALTNGKQYLNDSFTLFQLSSLSALPFLRQEPLTGNERVFAIAYGEAKWLSALPNVEKEVQAVAALYQAQTQIGDAATKASLLTGASSYEILHLATHYQPNMTDPLLSYLALASDEDGDDSLAVHEIYGLNLNRTKLVVLSVCHSQTSISTSADEIESLSSAFMRAGAPAVVASLWNVDDQATSELMTAFYTHLRQGKNKAEALRAAQVEMRANYPHPYYWAGFVLMGRP